MLDVLVVLVTGCSAAIFIATAVTISLLAAVRETRRHELCAFGVIICSRLPLAAAIVVAATPRTLVAGFYSCAAALIAYEIFSVRPLIGDLHEMGDGLGLYPPECFFQFKSINASGERVYRVVFRDPLC